MYYNLWNIRKVTSHSFSDCSSDQGTLKAVRQTKKCGMNSSVRLLKERRPTSILTGLEPRILTQAVSFKDEGKGKILNCCVDGGNRRHKCEGSTSCMPRLNSAATHVMSNFPHELFSEFILKDLKVKAEEQMVYCFQCHRKETMKVVRSRSSSRDLPRS